MSNARTTKVIDEEVRPLLGIYESDDCDELIAGNANHKKGPIAASTITTTTSTVVSLEKDQQSSSLPPPQQQQQQQQPPQSQQSRSKTHSWQNQLPFRGHGHPKSAKYVTWSWRLLRRKQFLMVLAILLMVLYINATMERDEEDERIPVLHYSHVPGMKGYLVWSERCQMPNLDPYLPEVMKFFKREKYKPCTGQKPLTRVEYNEKARQYVLRIEENAIKSYSKSGKVNCCYMSIERNGTGVQADEDVSLSSCVDFNGEVKLPSTIDNILVKCRDKKKQVYMNGHPMMADRKAIRNRLNTWQRKDNKRRDKAKKGPPSVLMIGIDSISRINLIRAMPKTAQYLYDNEWFEMSGYNKIDDNTFPNLMAVLTGRNKTNALAKCPPTVLHGLDNCSFIWKTFRDHGYVTAYAEDEAAINTFNYLKVGFDKSPVDYYLRPFLLSAEKHLRIKKKSNLIYCLGYQHAATFVYDYAVELATRYKNDPFFGLFWANSFSHNAISDCSSMDVKMVEYLRKFASLDTRDNTIVIFFSDHGIRFGPTRRTLSGHLEERLPFMFMWLPQHLKQAHPEFVNALSVNKNRLTNPYDLHMTLKHILSLSGRVANRKLLSAAEDCTRCQTLLEPVPHNRSCSDIAIDDHWCTCIPYESIHKNSDTVHKLAKATVEYINDFVANYRNGSFASLCVPLKFGSVDSAFRAQSTWNGVRGNGTIDTYHILFYTKPNKALFEATLRYGASTGAFEVTGEISRLNSYSKDSECVEDGAAKKYCSCSDKPLT